MGTTAIICLGNRYVADDAVGCRVYDHLTGIEAPLDIDIVDGGLCGLDLLWLIEGKRRVVFADAVTGLAEPGHIVVLDRDQTAAYATTYGHGAGLPYLLHMLPKVCRAPWPEIALVGIEGKADDRDVHTFAQRCLEIASHGLS